MSLWNRAVIALRSCWKANGFVFSKATISLFLVSEYVFVLFYLFIWFDYFLSQEVQEPQGHISGLQMVLEVLLFETLRSTSAHFFITKEKTNEKGFPGSLCVGSGLGRRSASFPLAASFFPTANDNVCRCTLTLLLLMSPFPCKVRGFPFSFPYYSNLLVFVSGHWLVLTHTFPS